MLACELGRLQNVQALIEHFEKRGKALKKEASDSDEGMEDYDEEGGDGDDMKADFDVDYINFKDKSSRTALQYAAFHGHVRICEVLIEAGAEVDTKNSK